MIEKIVMLLITVTLTFADSPISPDNPPEPMIDINITVLNTFAFEPGAPHMILGLDYDEANDRLALGSANAFDPEVGFYDPDDSSYLGEVAYSSALLNFGVCLNDDASRIYLTEWSNGKLFTYDWSSWSIIDSPAGTEGRGMDYRDGYIWVARGLNKDVMRFLPDGSDVSTFSTPQSNANLSGLTTFPLGTETGVLLTSYYDSRFFFYSFDGTSLTYLTAVDVPLFCNTPLGLAYSASRDSFFWCYTDGAVYTISELDIEIEMTSLQSYSFGRIKTLF